MARNKDNVINLENVNADHEMLIRIDERNKCEKEKWKTIHFICVTSTGSALTFITWLGSVVVDRWDAFHGATMTFIEIIRRTK